MKDFSIPTDYKPRLEAVAKKHAFASAEVLADTLVTKGLKALGAVDGKVVNQLKDVVDSHGYSSKEELVEHLLERGLSAYEVTEEDPEKFKARLRGLGYID